MATLFSRSAGCPRGRWQIEHVKRKGHFSMTADHIHQGYELYYLCEGERMYFIRDRSYRVKAGDLVFIDRRMVHKTSDTGMPDHERIVFYVERDWIEADYPEDAALLLEPFGSGNPVLTFSPQRQEAVRRIIEAIREELAADEPGRDIRLRHAVAELLLMGARARRLEESPAGAAEPDTPANARTTKVVRYLNEHYDQPLTLTGVADVFAISPYYLSRIFKATTGFAFSEYINLVRLKEAQRLLRETELPITAIALRTGFDNFSHFGKMFKKMAGMPPRAYRGGAPAAKPRAGAGN